MSERLTDEELERLRHIAAVHTGGITLRQSTALALFAELRALRLSPAEREALEWLRTQALAIQRERAAAGSDCFPNPARALEVISKLLGQGETK